jgi:hypothetical protein
MLRTLHHSLGAVSKVGAIFVIDVIPPAILAATFVNMECRVGLFPDEGKAISA